MTSADDLYASAIDLIASKVGYEAAFLALQRAFPGPTSRIDADLVGEITAILGQHPDWACRFADDGGRLDAVLQPEGKPDPGEARRIIGEVQAVFAKHGMPPDPGA